MNTDQIEFIRYGKDQLPRPFWKALLLVVLVGWFFLLQNLVLITVNQN